MQDSKNKYEVSVIIPTYNRGKLLNYTLSSLLKQNIDKDRFEVVIGDDGSSDNTREVVEKYKDRLNVKYVFQEDNGYRPGLARNKAIALSEGNICLLIDSSIILNTDCIERHILFHNVQEFAVAIGYVFGFDRTKESEKLLKKLVVLDDPAVSIDRLSKHDIFNDVRDFHYWKYDDKIEDLPAPWYYFWTCHLSVKRYNLLKVGAFDSAYDGRWGMEDMDLGFRLHQDGVKISLLRSASSIHYPHGKNKPQRNAEGYHNCQYFHNKFKTLETTLLLENYATSVDINELSIKMQGKETLV